MGKILSLLGHAKNNIQKNQLTACQQAAMEILGGDTNVFLTGEAGTGKSYLLSKYIKGKDAKRNPILASTGAAAILIGGRTFHSFFGLGILEHGPEATIQKAIKNKYVLDRLNMANCVVIDEISMLSGTVLATAEEIARKARDSKNPWGGLRIIAVGDFAQLPPVDDSLNGKDWAFLHNVWELSQFSTVLLKTVVRTDDKKYLKLLQSIRNGQVTTDVQEYLESRVINNIDEFDGTRLYPHRATVEAYNLKKLNELKGKLWEFETSYTGQDSYIDVLKKRAPIPEKILLKKGALVMIRVNDTSNAEPKMIFVNGSLGYVHKIKDDTIEIDLFTGRRIPIPKHSFKMFNADGEEIAQAYNFPINLAWASTIHKAQGATLDRVLVQLDSLWDPGQAYVALSRTRSGDDLFFNRWSPGSIIIEPLVQEFYQKLSNEI